MQNICLNGGWKVWHVPFGADISPFLGADFVPEGWLDADVPEDIHGTLRKAGVISGHHYDKDVKEECWIEEVDWLYMRAFYVDELNGRVTLEFDGLDTFCEVYLNGALLGSCDNMHRQWVFDVTDQLLSRRRNRLFVRFRAAPRFVEDFPTEGLFSTDTLDRIQARKAQMNYSWDFVGRCVTCGIWKPVRLRAVDHMRLSSVYAYTKTADDDGVWIGLNVAYCDVDGGEYDLRISMSRNGETNVTREVGASAQGNDFEFLVMKPALWWPRPYGEPALYQIEVELVRDGEVIDRSDFDFGIRTFEIIQEDQEDGRSFIFSVNGRRLFVRGGNWVPIRAIYTDIRDEEYDALIDYAVEGNLSMLRVWGGGIYESDRFFELCDRKGIMIWHDFMLACGVFPQHQAFLDNLYLEARDTILRCRNHPSLVLWAGDNENDEAYAWAGRPYDYKYDKTNRVALCNAARDFDPHRLYIPSSPYSPFEFYKGGDNPKSPHQGDMHIYITSAVPGNRMYYKNIRHYRPRFMSEFGFCSLPEKETFYRFNPRRVPLVNVERFAKTYPDPDFLSGQPEDFDTAIYRTQLYNSLAFKYWIEYMRSLKWTCAGTLYWKFNDPLADNHAVSMLFPTMMSTVDFMGRPKMTFYYTKRAYEDVIVTVQERPDGYEVMGVSELSNDMSGRLIVERMDFSGQVLDAESLDVHLLADRATSFISLPSNRWLGDPRREYLRVAFEGEGQTYVNRMLYADIGETHMLALSESELDARVRKEGSALYVTVSASAFVKDLRLYLQDVDAHYEDNYFDLDAGRSRTVRIALPEGAQINDKLLKLEGANAYAALTLDVV